ncbi:MAG: hypothetical protein AAGG07_10875 [Planctomycetota bacterium]
MKLKGINPIEQHIDKAVLGIVALVFLGALAFQFLPGRTNIEVGGESVPPERAFEPAEQAAERLKGRLAAAEPDLPELDVPDLVARFEQRRSVTPSREESAIALGRSLDLGLDDATPGEMVSGQTLAEFQPPAPADPIANVLYATIDPVAPLLIDGLAELLPTEQPFDLPGVTVEAAFSGAALAEALRRDPDGPSGEISSLPPSWWRDAVEVLDVEIERQRRGEDGWSTVEPVRALAGSLAQRVMESRPGPQALRQVVSDAADRSDVISRRPYPPLIAGPRWVPPSEAARLEEIEANRRQIAQLVEQRDALLADREEIERGTPGGPPGGPGEGGREDRRPPPGDRGGDPEDDANEDDAATRRRLNSIDGQLETIERRLASLGWVETDAEPSRSDTRRAALPRLLNDPGRVVWAHDLRAEPGATYRYRVRVVLNNPVYGRGTLLTPEQRQWATEPLVRTPWSQWTEPVSIPRPQQIFVTNARAGDAFGGGEPGASVEVYRFYYGFWRRATAGVEAGEEVLGRVRFGDAAALPLYEFPVASVENRGAPPPDGGRDGGREDRRPPSERPRRSDRRDVPPYEAVSGVEELIIRPGLVFLDAAEVPGGGGTSFEAVFRDEQGRILVEAPGTTVGAVTREELERSARAAADQPTPVPSSEED